MKNTDELINTILDCSDCNGQGVHYWANGEDYDFEYCDCNPYKVILDYDKSVVYEGELFTTSEAK